jgi:hypothetical protein
MARCVIFGRPLEANLVLIERSRTFLLEPGAGGGAGECDLDVEDELRLIVAGDRGTEGASAAPSLSPIGMGIVGLSGRGVLLHLLPSL